MSLMGQREYARHRDCALSAVQKAIKSGRIQLVEDARGRLRIDSEAADLAWRLNTDPARQQPDPAPGTAQADEPEDAELITAKGDTGERYRRARADREALRLERERMEYEQARGALISLEEAQAAVFTVFRALRDNVLLLPARLKHLLAAEDDPERVETQLDAELAAALASFDRAALERIATGADDPDDEGDG